MFVGWGVSVIAGVGVAAAVGAGASVATTGAGASVGTGVAAGAQADTVKPKIIRIPNKRNAVP